MGKSKTAIKPMNVKVVGDYYQVVSMFNKNKHKGYNVISNDIHQQPDLLVFCGGSDISTDLYGEKPIPGGAMQVDSFRDKREVDIFNRYRHLPKVGICRGGQLLNVLSGGSLWQDVDEHYGGHDIINVLPMANYDAGDELKCTSSHHQMMIPSDKGVVLAIAVNDSYTRGLSNKYRSYHKHPTPEYDTEVVWYEDTKSLCFQGHPEWTRLDEKSSTERYFFNLLEHFFR
jgi:gamma-glutamyl-gamma-aminobutyrate hydrolase PuuD